MPDGTTEGIVLCTGRLDGTTEGTVLRASKAGHNPSGGPVTMDFENIEKTSL